MGTIEQPLPASQFVLALANDGFILLWRPCRRICVHRQVMGKLATVTISAPTVVSEETAYLPGLTRAVPVVVIVMAAIGLSRPKERISKSLKGGENENEPWIAVWSNRAIHICRHAIECWVTLRKLGRR